jgi:parvulin-like peptidyl-prolyl isomerase
VKSKRNDNTNNIKLTLIALLSTMLLSTKVVAADTAKQNDTAEEAPTSIPTARDSNKEVIKADPTAESSAANKAQASPYFAKVGNMYITWIDYNYEYSIEARKKFYHAKPSESAVAAFQREIGNTLVTNAMLVQEAKRRKLKPDDAYVKEQISQFEQKFAKNPNWAESRARVLPILTERVQNENLRNKLEKLVRDVQSPTEKELRKYYAAHPEKFTSPPQQRIGIILLRVDPGAPDADWQQAAEQGKDLVKRLRAGEDFAELARQYSGDRTAEDGGDMGFLHEGMLPGLPSETVGKLQPGETSDPVNLMEGVAIFRLIDRQPSKTSSFKTVQDRAKKLWLAEHSENAWNSLLEKLKKNTPVQIDESHFLPLSAVANKPVENMGTTKP